YGAAAAFISSGTVRAVALTTKHAVSALPEVPPLAEAGVPGFHAAAWQGVIAPARTPPAIVAKLNAELNAAVAMNDVRARMREIGMIPVGAGSPEELAEVLQSEIARWGTAV